MGWTVLTAVSVTVIALLMLGFTIGALLLMRDLRRALERIGEVSRMLEQDGRPALLSVRSAAEDASKVVASVRGEVDGIVTASRQIREQATEVADRVTDRLH